jgi:hypothetical protein
MRPDVYATSVAGGAPAHGYIPGDPKGRTYWDGFNWGTMASRYGHFVVDSTPAVGSIWVEPAHGDNWWGHVAYVTGIVDSRYILVSEMNTTGHLEGPNYNVKRLILAGSQFIHGLQSSTPPPVTPSPPPAAAHPVFTVMNTSETPPDGVYFRRSPHTADTARITGLGVYSGEQVRLECYAWGDAVGSYSNRLWYYVTNMSRSSAGGQSNVGYLNSHYINDGLLANQIDAGVVAC